MRKNFLKEYSEFFTSIEGAFQFDAALLLIAHNQIINSQGIFGDVLEIGVRQGLSSIVVAALRGTGRRFFAVDLFDDMQSENVSSSGAGDKAAFVRNMSCFYENTGFLEIISSNSLALKPSDLGLEFSFCHIDGGHSDAETYHDLELCSQILIPGGLVAVDDYFNPSFPGVCEGAVRFMMEYPEALAPVAIGFNKVLFCKPGSSFSLNAVFASTFPYIPRDSAMLWGIPVNLFWSKLLYFFDLSLSTPGCLVRDSNTNLGAVYEPQTHHLSAKTNNVVQLPVKVTNNSTTPFQCGDHTFGLSYHLLSNDGVMLKRDNVRHFFKQPLQPAEQRIVELSILVPEEIGNYLVEIDLVWEGVMWFKDKGNPTSIVNLVVS